MKLLAFGLRLDVVAVSGIARQVSVRFHLELLCVYEQKIKGEYNVQLGR